MDGLEICLVNKAKRFTREENGALIVILCDKKGIINLECKLFNAWLAK